MQQLLQGPPPRHQPLAAPRPRPQGRALPRPPVHPRVCLPGRGQRGAGAAPVLSQDGRPAPDQGADRRHAGMETFKL